MSKELLKKLGIDLTDAPKETLGLWNIYKNV